MEDNTQLEADLMACLEHNCNVCKAVWFNNDQSTECPECGSQNYNTFFDEPPEDPHYEEEDRERPDDT